MAGKTCAHAGCRNPIRATETYCYRHGGASAAELDAGRVGRSIEQFTLGELEELRERRRVAQQQPLWRKYMSTPPRPPVSYDVVERVADAYARHLSITPETARAVLDAIRDELGTFDVAVPRRAAHARGRVDAIAARLAERLGADRVALMDVQGLVRKTARRPRFLSRTVTHRVIVLDPGTEQETVVDPFVAALAPVRTEVGERHVLESGLERVAVSPYADRPWMGPMEDYLYNGHFEWERRLLQRLSPAS